MPRDRNPVAKRGVKQIFETLSFRRDVTATDVRVLANAGDVTFSFSERHKANIGFSIMEAIDGEGDYSIAVSFNNAPSRLWFWGYSNPHGVNSF